jgi:hypothetical protein
MEENKQVVAEWKALNQPRLQEIKSANPELYSAVNLALQYLNQKLGGEELPAEVEEEVVVETTPMQTKQWTLDDFQNIKIVVDTPEKSQKFQELFFSLGGRWSALDSTTPNSLSNLDKIYLVTTGSTLLYIDADISFLQHKAKQIFYEDIFPEETITKPLTLEELKSTYIYLPTDDMREEFQKIVFDLGVDWVLSSKKEVNPDLGPYFAISKFGQMNYYDDSASIPGATLRGSDRLKDITKEWPEMRKRYVSSSIASTKTETSEWRFKTKQELESEFGTDFNRFSIPEGYFNDWYGQNLAEMYSSSKYANVKEAEDYLMNNDIQLGLSEFFLPKRYFTKDTLTSTQTNGYTLPIETYPSKLNNKYSFFEANDGSRKSPTQSAGDLKRAVINMPGNELTEILNTKFRGNDKNWYEINVGKGGTWTWKKLNPIDNYATQNKFIQGTQPTNASTSFTSTATSQTQQTTATKTWKPEDLVGKKLLWSGREYDVIEFRRNNPKFKLYTLKNTSGIELDGKLTMGAINNLLNDEYVKDISIIKQQPQPNTSNNFEASIQLLSDVELKQLYDETEEARKEFSSTEPEYLELSSQIVAIGDEMDKRNI